jgi:type IV secretory pathway VirB10-like protein
MTHSAPEPVQTDVQEDDESAALRLAVAEQQPASPPPLMPEAEPIEAGPRRRLLVAIAAAVVAVLLWMLFRSGPGEPAENHADVGEPERAAVESMANEGDPSWMKAVDTTARPPAADAVVPPVYAPVGPGASAFQQTGAPTDSVAAPGALTPPTAMDASAATQAEDPRRQSFLAALRSKPLQGDASFSADVNPVQPVDEIPPPPSLAEMEAAAYAEAERRSVPPAGFAAAGLPAATAFQAESGEPGAGASSRSGYVTGAAGPAPQQASPQVIAPQVSPAPAGSVVVPIGTVIEGQLHTAINSDVPGSVMGMVTRNVYDAAQRVVVIPRYSWLFGTYESDVAAGQARLVVQWTAVRFPTGETYALPALRAGEVTGASGLPARVNNHYGRVFGHAILSSIIAAGFHSGGGDDEPRSRRDALAEATAQHLGQTAAEVTRRNLSIKPTLRGLHMTRFLIIVDRDLVFTPPARR